MSISDRLSPYVFCHEIEKTHPMRGEMDGTVFIVIHTHFREDVPEILLDRKRLSVNSSFITDADVCNRGNKVDFNFYSSRDWLLFSKFKSVSKSGQSKEQGFVLVTNLATKTKISSQKLTDQALKVVHTRQSFLLSFSERFSFPCPTILTFSCLSCIFRRVFIKSSKTNKNFFLHFCFFLFTLNFIIVSTLNFQRPFDYRFRQLFRL